MNKKPLISHQQRKLLFDFPKALVETAKTLRTSTSQIGFLLLCGYFKATKRFFLPADFHERDIQAAAQSLEIQSQDFHPDDYSESTRLRHQRMILNFYGFQPFDSSAEASLNQEIATMAQSYLKPRLMFDRCADFLIRQRVQLPKAGTLTELIRSGLQKHKATLIQTMAAHLSDSQRQLLDELLVTAEIQTSYQLTLLKKLSQSTRPSKLKESVADFQRLSQLYFQLEDVLEALQLGRAGVRYLAGSVMRSEIFQLQRREAHDRYIHLTAFIAHQFFRLQDNLIDALLSVMTNFKNRVKSEHKEQVFSQHQQRAQQTQALKTAALGLAERMQQILGLTQNSALSSDEKVEQIQALAQSDSATDGESFEKTLNASTGANIDYHEILQNHSLWCQNRLTPLVKALDFESLQAESPLMEAITHFKACDGTLTRQAPTEFLNEHEQDALTHEDGRFRPSLYKVFLFEHLASAIQSGQLNLKYGYKYRPMDSYLIDPERWQTEKGALLERAGLTQWADPKPILTELGNALHLQYVNTNRRVPDNPHLSFRRDGSFFIRTPAADSDPSPEPLRSLFPQRHDVPIAEVLYTVDQHCQMLSCLEHWQQSHAPPKTSIATLIAGILGLGCQIGVRRMARISSRLSENELEHAVNWRFSLENIRAANDQVVQAMEAMELPKQYQPQADWRHSASDGQKFEVHGESLHASRSFKHFGQEQGVSAYTFVDERHLLWYSLVMSASNRESAYVIDGLMHNEIVKSDIHSTDTHGYTEVIFALTHLLGFSFAPRIKGVGRQTLYIFKPKKLAHPDWKIAPAKTVNTELIEAHWDELLRLITTIALKENTASDILRRLNSYSKQHRLYQALKAFGQIIKSLFILRYVEDLELRQAIEKQLNKVELSNLFSRAVAVGSPNVYRQAEKEEQEIAEACNRLIKNSIICWNYLYLQHQLDKSPTPEAREELLQQIRQHSPMAWAHINLLGEYDFSERTLQDSMGILPPKLAASGRRIFGS